LPVVYLDDEPIITGGFAPNILEKLVWEEHSKHVSDSK
jgi:hypothetical protein